MHEVWITAKGTIWAKVGLDKGTWLNNQNEKQELGELILPLSENLVWSSQS